MSTHVVLSEDPEYQLQYTVCLATAKGLFWLKNQPVVVDLFYDNVYASTLTLSDKIMFVYSYIFCTSVVHLDHPLRWKRSTRCTFDWTERVRLAVQSLKLDSLNYPPVTRVKSEWPVG
jgi:hypothetical protein